jgi:hypothetical protein
VGTIVTTMTVIEVIAVIEGIRATTRMAGLRVLVGIGRFNWNAPVEVRAIRCAGWMWAAGVTFGWSGRCPEAVASRGAAGAGIEPASG